MSQLNAIALTIGLALNQIQSHFNDRSRDCVGPRRNSPTVFFNDSPRHRQTERGLVDAGAGERIEKNKTLVVVERRAIILYFNL